MANNMWNLLKKLYGLCQVQGMYEMHVVNPRESAKPKEHPAIPPTQPASVLSLQEAPSRSRIRLPSNSYNPEVLRRRRPWWARKWNPESTQPSLSRPMRRDNCRRHLTEAGTVCATRNAVVHTETSRHWKSKRKRLQSFTFDVY